MWARAGIGIVRRHWWEAAILTAAVTYSVGAALAQDMMVVEGSLVLDSRLDLAIAFMPQGWPTLAALLWAPLVVFRRGTGSRTTRGRVWGGALLLVVAVVGGVGLGCLGALVSGNGIVVGHGETLVALLASMLVLYLAASALIVATGHFWWGALVAVAALVGVRVGAVSSGWPLLTGLQEWIALGRFGPGVLMESPGIVAGVVLEPEWEQMNPWAGLMLWSFAAVAVAVVAVRLKEGRAPYGGCPGPDARG